MSVQFMPFQNDEALLSYQRRKYQAYAMLDSRHIRRYLIAIGNYKIASAQLYDLAVVAVFRLLELHYYKH